MSVLRRLLFCWADGEDPGKEGGYERTATTPCDDVKQADVISSRLENGRHAIVLDVDWPVTLVESSEGRHHLYIDSPSLEWVDYVALLDALREAKVIESGFFHASMARERTQLRARPGAPFFYEEPSA